jgi:ATP phosphoribosyltransferase regulatory subunit
MIHQPPAGARDLLPLEVAQKSWINDCLQQTFQRWGYQRIVTSTLEWVETLTAGGAIARDNVIQIHNNTDRPLGLRPELTASIARAAVTRMAENNNPQRLCYRANVFRNPSAKDRGKQVEFYQAGVELLYAGGAIADSEIILLAADCFKVLGIEDWYLLLGEAGLTRSLLELFPEDLRQQIKDCTIALDRVRLDNLGLEGEIRALALLLFDLRGTPEEVFAKLASLNLNQRIIEEVDRLKKAIEIVNKTSEGHLPIILDLSLLQNFNYYTGIVFDLVKSQNNQLRILGQGGRYDRLLEVYHPKQESSSGIGFSLNIEELHACLLSNSQMPKQTPKIDWLVIPEDGDAEHHAFIHAQKLRSSETLMRVEIDLGVRTPEEIRQYAIDSRIDNLVWVTKDGTTKTETNLLNFDLS